MNSSPKVNVALATYNGERFLAPFLDSLVRQTYPQIEIVVADDGSSDGTVELLDAYRDRLSIKYLGSERRGVLGNFERAIIGCTANYVVLADQDDIWHADKIQRLFELAQKVEGKSGANKPVLVYSDLSLVAEDLSIISPSFFDVTLKSRDARYLRDFALDNHVPGCATLANRALLDIALPFPAVSIHDWWLNVLAATAGTVAAHPASLIDYRQHGGNAIGIGAAALHPLLKWMTAIAKPLSFATTRIKQAKVRAGLVARQLIAAEQRLLMCGYLDAASAIRALLEMRGCTLYRAFEGAATGLRRVDSTLTIFFLGRLNRSAASANRDPNVSEA